MTDISLSVPTVTTAIKRLLPALPYRTDPALPVLTNVLVTIANDAISLRAVDRTFDQILDVTVGVSGTATVKKGKFLVPGRALAKFAATFGKDETVTITTTDDKTTFTCGTTSVTHPAWDPREFPAATPLTKASKQKIDFDAIGHVLPAASTDDARPILTGIHISGNRTAATDAFRLYLCESSVTVKTPLLIPRHAAAMLAKIGGTHEITHDTNHLLFQAEGFSLNARLLPGEFPNYQSFLPEQAKTRPMIRWEGTEFPTAVERLARLARSIPTLKGLPIRFSGDPLVAAIVNAHEANTELVATLSGSCDIPVAFNYQYLNDCLKGTPARCIEGVDALKPFVIRWDTDDHQHVRLLMPVRVS